MPPGVSVAIITPLYGHAYDHFVDGWANAIDKLERQPDEVIIATDWYREDNVQLFNQKYIQTRSDHEHYGWKYPTAYHLNEAVKEANTEWVWIVEIDDRPFPDALTGIDYLGPDWQAWLMGFVASDNGEVYIPKSLPKNDYLDIEMYGNPYPSGCAFRKSAIINAGGYPDVALQDWAIWRRIVANGGRIFPSGRAHYLYRRDLDNRSATELSQNREELFAEMRASESF